MNTLKRKALAIAVAAAVLLPSGIVHADDVPRIIPYEGTIELDGRAYNGEIHMRVILYNGVSAEQWREEYSSGVGAHGPPVQVYAGHFSIPLGQHNALGNRVT